MSVGTRSLKVKIGPAFSIVAALSACSRLPANEAKVNEIVDAAHNRDWETFNALAGNVPIDIRSVSPDLPIPNELKFATRRFVVSDVPNLDAGHYGWGGCGAKQNLSQQGDIVEASWYCQNVTDVGAGMEFEFHKNKLVHVYTIYEVLG